MNDPHSSVPSVCHVIVGWYSLQQQSTHLASITEVCRQKKKEEKPKISKDWLHFVKVTCKIPKCNICGKINVAKCGNTNNLIKHLIIHDNNL